MLGRRCYAVTALCSVVLHGILLGHATNPIVMLLTVTMMLACLYCARDIWLRGTVRSWVLVAAMNLAMIAVHLPMSSAHHHGGGFGPAAPLPESSAMTLATALAVVEVVIAAAVLWFRTRGWAPVAAERYPPVTADRYPRAGSELT